MRLRAAVCAAAVCSALLVATGGTSRATLSPAELARRSAVVVRVGTKEITAGEVEDRLAAVPRFQLATMGDTADAIRRKFIQDVIVPEVLVSAGAVKQHVDQEIVIQNNLRRALANATMRVARSQVPALGSITMDEIRKFYGDNRNKFDSPVRYGVWRILCATREEAAAVLEAAKQGLNTENFSKLAREHSVDKATNLRFGNLGFVDTDGNSNEAGLKVDPAIAKAAAAVKDGQLVPQPVKEGQGWAVIWHKGTVPAAHRTAEEAAPQIREAIHRERMDEAAKAMIEKLRREHLTDFNEGMLNGIDVSSVDGEVMPRRRPGQASPLHQVGRAAPPKPQ
jgi:peptidyl-prolyl cis-trans isomerase C